MNKYENCVINILRALGIFDQVDISRIHFSKKPVRIRSDSPESLSSSIGIGPIEELATSIAEKTLLEPIIVKVIADGYEVVAGNRRLTACKLLKWRTIPCHIVELDDKEAYEISLIENVQRKTLNPIEEAMAFKRYVEDFGWGGASHLALRIGKSQVYVSKRIQLLQLPQRTQEKIMHGQIRPGIAQELLSLDKETAEKFTELIEKDRLKRAQIRRVVKSINDQAPLNKYDEESDSDQTYDEVLLSIDRAIKGCITVLRSKLVSFDDVIEPFDEDWITKQILMEYRVIIHNEIDTFIRLRNKIKRRVRPVYILNRKEKVNQDLLQAR